VIAILMYELGGCNTIRRAFPDPDDRERGGRII
jgi:hypothetical protein